MDERNGEVFDHHAELFAQIGSDADHDAFKDFILEPGGLLDQAAKPPDTSHASQDTLWGPFHSEEDTAVLDSLVKYLPGEEPSLETIKRGLMDSLQRLSADRAAQDLLDHELKELEHLAWNGCDPTPCGSLDKNGNSSLPRPLAPHLTTRLSPSASVESNVHTPTTSYESASPLSSNRTPIRSDESISPMGSGASAHSGHTPLQEDTASPLRPEPKSACPPVPEPPKTDSSELLDVRLCQTPLPPAPHRTPSPAPGPSTPRTETFTREEPTKTIRPDLVPYVCATRIDESNRKAVRRTSCSDSAECAEPGESVSDAKRKRRRKGEEGGAKRRVRRKPVTIYQSTVSPEAAGIKLKIKLAPARPRPRRRSRRQWGSSEEEGPSRGRKTARGNGSEATEQSDWGSRMPPELLQRVFQFAVDDVGSVPCLVRFSSVCKLWHSVSIKPELWQNIDLSSPYIRQRCRIDRYFRWLLENRLGSMQDLNLSGWKFTNITMILSLIGAHCTEIESIGLAGWQGLHCEHLRSLLQDCTRLSKLDLSDISPESKTANSAVSQKSITYLTQTMGSRLTQLILAHNTLTCLPQIISSLASSCPNLQVLDLSNVRRVSHTEFALNIEQLQEGCRLLRVLRITNSCITLAAVPLEVQVASPGFEHLEELSMAEHQGPESLRITSVMDDACLERILKCSQRLKLLDVRGCARVTDCSLVRVSAWDIEHLFLSGCCVTRQAGSGLELIAQKWAHSLVELDLAWTTVTSDLNSALLAIAEQAKESPLRTLNLCGSSVTLEPVRAVLDKCPQLQSLNLQSCRGLPRGVKRLYEGAQLAELRAQLAQAPPSAAPPSEEEVAE